MTQPAEQTDRRYAEEWLESLRASNRCRWCGEGHKQLTKNGLCGSCKRVENKIAALQAKTSATFTKLDSFNQGLLARNLRIAEKMKELREIDGEELESILSGEEFTTTKLENLYCDLSLAIGHNRNLHFHLANRLGWTFDTAQRRILGYLIWETFHADRKRKSMKAAMNVLTLEAGSPMS